MAREDLRLTYSSNAGVTYSIYFDNFLDSQIPRSTLGQGSIQYGVLGTTYSQGPAALQPNIWTIDAIAQNRVTSRALKNSAQYNEVRLIKEMYLAWDTDRANGLAAKCQVQDQVLGFGTTYTAEAWFTDPPTYTIIGDYSSKLIQVVFGLAEV